MAFLFLSCVSGCVDLCVKVLVLDAEESETKASCPVHGGGSFFLFSFIVINCNWIMFNVVHVAWWWFGSFNCFPYFCIVHLWGVEVDRNVKCHCGYLASVTNKSGGQVAPQSTMP